MRLKTESGIGSMDREDKSSSTTNQDVKSILNRLDIQDLDPFSITKTSSPASEWPTSSLNEPAEPHMPPPKPYFDRSTSAPNTLNRLQLARLRSSSPPRPQKLPLRIAVLRGLTQSLPMISPSRASHNRIIGYGVLSAEKTGRS